MKVLVRTIPHSVSVQQKIVASSYLVMPCYVFPPRQCEEMRRCSSVVSKVATLRNELTRKEMHAVIRFARAQIT